MGIYHVRKDLTGQRFGRLFVTKFIGVHKTQGNDHGFSIWECLCDCGKIKQFQTRSLLRGSCRSCGCLRTERARKKPGESTLNGLYCEYRAGARHRKYDFELTKEEFTVLVNNNCVYCGSPPSTLKRRSASNKLSKEWAKQSEITCNGVDRVDNSKGYIVSNCVSCCKLCNQMKHALHRDEFLNHIGRIYKFKSKEENNE